MNIRSMTRQALALAVGLSSALLQAQTYPTKPLNMMVAWPAGGGGDFVGRIMSKEMSASLGQPIIIENSPGAGGSIGNSKAMKAPADGYTLIVSSPIDMILAPLTFSSANYKAEDAKTIAFVGRSDLMIVTRKDLPVSNIAELAALLKANAAKPLTYCTPGIVSLYHLVGERLNMVTGAKSVHVPYTGFPQCATDVVSGQVDFAYLAVGGPFPGFVDNGSLKAIAILGDAPNPRLPKVPLASASKGFEDFKFSVWVGLHVNGKVPDAAADVLNKAAYAALAKPEVRKSIESTGGVIGAPLNLQQAQAAYLKEIELYQNIAKTVGLARQ